MRKVDTEPRLACFKKIALSFLAVSIVSWFTIRDYRAALEVCARPLQSRSKDAKCLVPVLGRLRVVRLLFSLAITVRHEDNKEQESNVIKSRCRGQVRIQLGAGRTTKRKN